MPDSTIIVALINLIPAFCSAIVWPLAIIVAIYVFRRPIRDALSSLQVEQQDRLLKRVKLGNVEWEYDSIPKELTEQIEASQSIETHPQLWWIKQIPPEILQIASISLEWAIKTYWSITELEIMALGHLYDIVPKPANSAPEAMQILNDKKLLSDQELDNYFSTQSFLAEINSAELHIDERPDIGATILMRILLVNRAIDSLNKKAKPTDESEQPQTT